MIVLWILTLFCVASDCISSQDTSARTFFDALIAPFENTQAKVRHPTDSGRQLQHHLLHKHNGTDSIKLISVVIAHDECEYYKLAQAVQRRYMNSHPNVTSYFVKFNDSNPDGSLLNGDTYTFKQRFEKENTRNMLLKTLMAMKLMLHNFEWDFLLRTNLSSLFHWDRMLAVLDSFRKYDVVANVVANSFPTGCGMFLSRHLVSRIVHYWIDLGKEMSKEGNLTHVDFDKLMKHFSHYNDDEVLGEIIARNGVPVTAWKNINFVVVKPATPINHTYFHLRCRTSETSCGADRLSDEIPMMNKWVDAWYGNNSGVAGKSLRI